MSSSEKYLCEIKQIYDSSTMSVFPFICRKTHVMSTFQPILNALKEMYTYKYVYMYVCIVFSMIIFIIISDATTHEYSSEIMILLSIKAEIVSDSYLQKQYKLF